MLLVADVKKNKRRPLSDSEKNLTGFDQLKAVRSDVPAITHVDWSARIQSVNRNTNPLYWRLIKAFEEKTGCPVIINTSFNVRGEPIVCTPEDAYRCFMRTYMDYLFLGRFMLDKKNQPEFQEPVDWRVQYELD
jgi:carbamoyltransferase